MHTRPEPGAESARTSQGLVGKREVPSGGARPPEKVPNRAPWRGLGFLGGLTLNITREDMGTHPREELLVLNLLEL